MSDLGRFRRLYVRDWLQRGVQGLDDGQRVAWLYCMTGPQSTSVGIYRLSTAVAVEDLGNVTAEDFERRFAVVREALGWHFESDVRVLWIPRWLEDNPPQSPNVVVSWRKLLSNVPDCAVKADATDAIHLFLKDRPEAFRQAFGSYRVNLSQDAKKSKASPKSNQGSGIRGSENQGNREQAALRAVALKGRTKNPIVPTPDAQVLSIAQEVIREFSGETENLVDHVLYFCRERKVEADRGTVLVALAQSRESMVW